MDDLIDVTVHTIRRETCPTCGAKAGRPCAGTDGDLQVHRSRLACERRVVNLAESGLRFHRLHPDQRTLEVKSEDGIEVWGPCVGRSYAIRFMGREFEFDHAIRLTEAERKEKIRQGRQKARPWPTESKGAARIA